MAEKTDVSKLTPTTAAFLVGLLSSQASAATMEAVFTGSFGEFGYDETGVFGAAYTELQGLDYSLKFTYDTAVGNRNTTPNSDGVYGGSFDAGPHVSPISSAILVINGVGRSFGSSYYGDVSISQYLPNQYMFEYYVQDTNGVGTTDMLRMSFYSGMPINPNVEQEYSFAGNPSSTGAFEIYNYDPDTYETVEFAYGYGLTVDTFTFTQISTIPPISPVPLPAGAGLLAAGLGALVALRVRRRGTALPAA